MWACPRSVEQFVPRGVNSLTALLTLALLTFGCGKVDNPSDPRVFRVAIPAPPVSLDPAFARDQTTAWVGQQLFEGLVRLDTSLQPAPALAKRWQVSPDGLHYSFTLERDAFFHEDACFGQQGARLASRHVVAADVVYSLTRLADPRTASPGQWLMNGRVAGVDSFQRGLATSISGLAAPNDSTVEIRLVRPFAPMLSLLAMPYAGVVPHEAVALYGRSFGQHPVGSGPFRLAVATPEELILRRHNNYSPAPRIEAVQVRVLRSRLTALRELLRGRLDLIDGIDPTLKDDVLTPEGALQPRYRGRIELVSVPALTTEYLGFNLSDTASVWRELRLRKAVAYAIDRPALVRYLRNGLGRAAVGLLPEGMPGFAPERLSGYGYDPTRAKALLAAAGYPNGKGLPVLHLLTGPSYRAQGELLQSQLAEVGIRVAVDVAEGAAAREQIAQGSAECWRASWQADYPTAENFFALFYSPNHAPAGPNTTRYADPDFDRGYEALTLHDTPEACHQLEQRLLLASPAVFLYHYTIVRLVNPRVRGLRHSPMELLLDLRTVHLLPPDSPIQPTH
jgi:oligopeptide transport system substrate-binding protein